MNILFLGDIFGKPGRNCLKHEIPKLVKEYEIDTVIANSENASGGIGINPDIADMLFNTGIDVLTSGNHIYKKREINYYITREPRLLKPANYPPGTPGNGYYIYTKEKTKDLKIAVINICGRVFLENIDCPFRTMDDLLAIIKREATVTIVDFHAEVTSEKVAMGWYLDGRVTAVLGTHTHIQTADERILPNGTAYITDVGMVGPRDSVIGVKKELIIERFLTMMPQKFTVATDDVWLNGVVVEADEENGAAKKIIRVNYKVEYHD